MSFSFTALFFLLTLKCAANPLADASEMSEHGNFKGATAVLRAALQDDKFSLGQRKKIKFQIDLLDRIRKDYPTTKQSLSAELAKSLKDFSRTEFEKWIKEGRFDSRVIDGKEYFLLTSVNNLYFRYPDLNSRLLSPKNESNEQNERLKYARIIKEAARAQKTPYVLPYHFKCRMTVTAARNAAPAGEIIRAWLPIPRTYPFQTDFKLLGSSPAVKVLAPETSPIRSAYFEQIAQKDRDTKFQVSYEYTAYGVCFKLLPNEIRPIDLKDPELEKFTREAPHVVFTGRIKQLADEIIGPEKNPLRKAKAFYDWIADEIKYSYAREYSTMTNISDYCFGHHYGDCGQEALLFITLCRSQGIPARWQTGWNTFPGVKTIHDWCEIYLAPYGWIPVDPWAGIFAMRYCTALSPDEQRELRDFYFGGLDQYRMAANSDHSIPLDPPKTTMRSDDVDFQRGELEWDKANIYFDKYTFDLVAEKTSMPSRE